MMHGGLGEPVTITAALVTTAKSAAVAKITKKFADGIAGIFGDTPTDRERKASAARALQDALNGNPAGVQWLLARANIRPDRAIVAPAPDHARIIFRKALREYYTAVGVMPPDDIKRAIWAKDSHIPESVKRGIPQMPGVIVPNTTSPSSPNAPLPATGPAVPSSGGLGPSLPSMPLQAGLGDVNPWIAGLVIGGLALAVIRRGR